MASHVNPKIQAALGLAARGLHVLPAAENAKPALIMNWEAEASTDPEQIEKWARLFPNCNWAVAPDRSGHLVLDLDRKNGKDGVAELERLSRDLGFEIADTLVVETPSGGLHIYLRGQANNSAGKIAPGIDVRGRGGYVVAPGSEIDGKPYKVIRDLDEWDAIPAAPAALLALVNQRRQAIAAPEGIRLDTPLAITRATRLLQDYAASGHVAIEGQGGDECTYAVAAEVMSLGNSEDSAFDLLSEHWNPLCNPPWDADELRIKIGNAGRYAQNEPGALAVLSVRDRIPPDVLDRLIADSASPGPAEQPVTNDTGWSFGLYDPVADATLPPITYRDRNRLWPDSPGKTVTQVIAGPKQHKTNWIMAELFRLAIADINHDQ